MQQPDFVKMERGLLDDWYKTGVVKKYLAKNKNSPKYFSFLDGPITANNPMGVHHAWGRTYKDLLQRFKNMQGYRQRFQNGFDSQGLWVEVEVEKELGFKNKKDIETFGVAKFVQLCRDRVRKYSQIQTEQSKRLGYFMDWDNSYYTLSDDNNYMIWRFLKVVYENGWLYKGYDSVPWCPRCATAISQHEMLTEDYKEVTHKAIYLDFPVVGANDQYLLVWTTTPWTVPANIAVAVDRQIEYCLVGYGKKSYWLAKDAVKAIFSGKKYKIIKSVRGDKLVGLKYEGAFDDLPKVKKVLEENPDKFHSVIETDPLILPITTSEGTGLVHTAVSAGSEDFSLGRKLGLPMIPVINDDASYMNGLGFLSGKNAKDNPGIIINYLEKLSGEGKHFIFSTRNHKHRYPACWRCKAELVWKVTDEWYIAMDKPQGNVLEGQAALSLRERMIKVAKEINWLPSFGLKRELDWLNSMHDWLISKKNRYWGLALPIWECTRCGNFEVIGSKEELKQAAVEGWGKFSGKSPHKPQIDEIKINCSKCGDLISRVEPVGNPWLDAGIVAYSTVSTNNKAAGFEPSKTKPLYLTDKKEWEKWVPADIITESFPGQFKNWFYAMIAMSTVLEDIKPTKSVLGFSTLLSEDGRPMHKSWGNMIEFNEGADKIGVDVMRWMYVRQNPVDNLVFGYRSADETRRKFHLKLWNTYNFFVTYADLDQWKAPRGASHTIHPTYVLDKWILARLKQMSRGVTQNLENYDIYSASGEIESFLDDMSLWYIRRSRDRVGPVAEESSLKKAFYDTTHFVLLTLSKLLAPFTPFLSETIYKNLTQEESVHLSEWPEVSKLRSYEKKLIADMRGIRQIVEKVHAERKEKEIPVRQPLAKLTIKNLKSINAKLDFLIMDEVNVKSVEFIEGKGKMSIALDTKVTPELKEEAEARDLLRKIQAKRRDMGMELSQKIDLTTSWLPINKNLVLWITKKAQVRNITKGKEFKVIKAI